MHIARCHMGIGNNIVLAVHRGMIQLEKAFAGNARELFESYLNSVFTQKGEGWARLKIGDIAKVSYGYTAKATQDEVGPRFLRIIDIKANGVCWDNVPFCKINEKDHQKHRVSTGDIVFARTGATTGKSYLISSPPDAVCASYESSYRCRLIPSPP